MQKIDPVLSFADEILRRFDRHHEIIGVLSTGVSKVVRATTGNHGAVCLKISSMVFNDASTDRTKKYPRNEIEVFQKIDGVSWAPKMLASADDFSWLIREWSGEKTADNLRGANWTKERLVSFWVFMEHVLRFFNQQGDPMVVRDIKPRNISFDEDRFYFFDFSATKTLDKARHSAVAPRIGNNSNYYMAPEIVRSEFSKLTLSCDYFSFASLVHLFLVGKHAWTNSVEDPEASRLQYLVEYDVAAENLNKRLQELGFGPVDRTFLCSCLHPDAEQRPTRMKLPHASAL